MIDESKLSVRFLKAFDIVPDPKPVHMEFWPVETPDGPVMVGRHVETPVQSKAQTDEKDQPRD